MQQRATAVGFFLVPSSLVRVLWGRCAAAGFPVQGFVTSSITLEVILTSYQALPLAWRIQLSAIAKAIARSWSWLRLK